MWNLSFILAQFAGIIVFIFDVIAGQCKTQKKILLYSTLAYTVDLSVFLLLSAETGTGLAIYNLIRCFLFYLYISKERKPSILLLVFCFIFIIVDTVFVYENFYSILIMIASFVATYALWQTSPFVTRILFLISDSLWVLYCFSVGAYATGVLLLVENCFLIYAIRKYDLRRENKKN
jgi:hypothetical protein